MCSTPGACDAMRSVCDSKGDGNDVNHTVLKVPWVLRMGYVKEQCCKPFLVTSHLFSVRIF